jgi:hypothetical protein
MAPTSDRRPRRCCSASRPAGRPSGHGAVLRRGGQAEHGALGPGQGEHVGHARAPLGQGPGLVEGDGADAADGLQGAAAFDQQAAPGADRQAGGDGRGRGKDEGAGAGDQQQRQATVDPGAPVRAKKERRRDGDQGRDGHRYRRVDGREAIDEASGGSARPAHRRRRSRGRCRCRRSSARRAVRRRRHSPASARARTPPAWVQSTTKAKPAASSSRPRVVGAMPSSPLRDGPAKVVAAVVEVATVASPSRAGTRRPSPRASPSRGSGGGGRSRDLPW